VRGEVRKTSAKPRHPAYTAFRVPVQGFPVSLVFFGVCSCHQRFLPSTGSGRCIHLCKLGPLRAGVQFRIWMPKQEQRNIRMTQCAESKLPLDEGKVLRLPDLEFSAAC
jgi:hypothetical protein